MQHWERALLQRDALRAATKAKPASRVQTSRADRQEPNMIQLELAFSESSRIRAHSNDFDDTDTPQIPAEPETPDEENPPGLPDPTEVGEDG